MTEKEIRALVRADPDIRKLWNEGYAEGVQHERRCMRRERRQEVVNLIVAAAQRRLAR